MIDLGARSGHNYPQYEKEHIESLLVRDADGMYYIDYFEKVQSELDDPLYDFPTYIDNLANIIRSGLRSSKSPVDVRIKYYWMKEKYNALVEKATSREWVEYLREQGESELADYYESLKKISPNR